VPTTKSWGAGICTSKVGEGQAHTNAPILEPVFISTGYTIEGPEGFPYTYKGRFAVPL